MTIWAGSSETFDHEPRAVSIVMNCPPELLRRLVTSLSERAHNHSIAVTASYTTGDNPALDHVVVRVEGERYNLEGHCNNYSNSRTFGLFFFPKGSPMRCPLLAHSRHRCRR